MTYQPTTGQPCNCKRGQQRDNCPQCEGTGMRIDFAAIRARNASNTFKTQLLANMREAIRAAREEGTTSMSVECFRQNVRTPSPHMDGAPSPVAYPVIFADLVRANADVHAFARS